MDIRQTPTTRIRWFQFRLRTLLGFVLLCSIVCSVFTSVRQRGRLQREAVTAIRKAEGWVWYDHQPLAWGHKLNPSRKVPSAWLVRIFGIDVFANVAMVKFLPHSDVEAAKHLRDFPELHTLDLSEVPVGDAQLEHVKLLDNLRELDLRQTSITDAGIKHLSGLAKLEVLDLQQTNITDAGLRHIGNLTNLRILRLSETSITGEGLEHLRKLTKLEVQLC